MYSVYHNMADYILQTFLKLSWSISWKIIHIYGKRNNFFWNKEAMMIFMFFLSSVYENEIVCSYPGWVLSCCSGSLMYCVNVITLWAMSKLWLTHCHITYMWYLLDVRLLANMYVSQLLVHVNKISQYCHSNSIMYTNVHQNEVRSQ